ncbi:MAG: hypothetical protein LBT54_02665, partial [Bifidobacteriaceae bacterium]|nr:hypothetical protein [Bifidobacteriaceae bacterium]
MIRHDNANARAARVVREVARQVALGAVLTGALGAVLAGALGAVPTGALGAGAAGAAGAAGQVGAATGAPAADPDPAAGAEAADPDPDVLPVVLIGTGGVSWADVSEEATPWLWALAANHETAIGN